MPSQWAIWQLIDSGFPTGSFAHSGGLEAAAQAGLLPDESALMNFVQANAVAMAHGTLPLVRRAWASLEGLLDADARCELFLNHDVANRASRAQGQAMAASAALALQATELLDLARRVRQRETPGHLAPVFGMVMRCAGCAADETDRLFQFATARSCFSAAVRLGVVGPLEAQRMLVNLEAHVPALPLAGAVAAEPVSVSPMLDLLQAQQARLYSRLFQS